ncbi:uncharacterized protein F5891DRAFT_981665 [Suillus fuscotomentosus]|uniref:Uncharacterized protein n=1 Tax=Suillus fuscotomentosus TaxID=1912939 RepID=A0AAD4HKG6_9AGAM|nr:uncharacterized protein F5891DRAFT_981665 [Suillus fuscotomentosus]KAG1898769.1 hypothetical protein F5891DRAFT_981665 [Suillus fuscotomentosus]
MASDTTGTLNYMLAPPDGSRPYHNGEDPYDMQIEDVRGKEELYKLDSAGFQYGREAAKHTSFLNNDEVEREYYPESIDLIRRVTGASSIVIFDHISTQWSTMFWATKLIILAPLENAGVETLVGET